MGLHALGLRRGEVVALIGRNRPNGESFEVMVPAFSLDAPGIPARLN